MNDRSDQRNSGNRRRQRHRPGQGGHGQKRNQSRRRSGGQRRHPQGPRLTLEERVTKKYEHFLEQHLQARKKYFELYHRADPRQKEKCEQAFYRTLNELREFEASLKGEEREFFDKRYENHGELDLTYTKNREISPEGKIEIQRPEDIEDPHVLEIQKKVDFSNDQEESCGTIEDYWKYKGIDPQAREN